MWWSVEGLGPARNRLILPHWIDRHATAESPMRSGRTMRALRPNSAMIERVLFDEDAKTLCISFRQSGQYVYEGVPRAVYDALAKAASAGSFFNECIKGHFPCRPARRRHRPDD